MDSIFTFSNSDRSLGHKFSLIKSSKSECSFPVSEYHTILTERNLEERFDESRNPCSRGENDLSLDENGAFAHHLLTANLIGLIGINNGTCSTKTI